MHFLNKFSLDNDVILVHRKLSQKLITLEDFFNLHNLQSFQDEGKKIDQVMMEKSLKDYAFLI